ncbi:MAG: zinc ribbon domain-containing protein [Pirellulales bacterium]|jgi:putative FmdB family regulatory protein|nr:zinc ribbon domain-containing protein [Pirellulales bacterium]
MPTYDYVCDGCGHAFELFQSITDKVKRTCPECKKRKLRRLIGTGAAIMFKGSGFYQTDYRSDSYKKGAAADKSTSSGNKEGGDKKSSGESSKSSSSGDAKPAAKKSES